VYGSEVTFVGGSELVGLSPKRNYLLKAYVDLLPRMISLCEYKDSMLN
jgi:hypothetical protein